MNAGDIGRSLGNGISNIANYSAASAARANGISRAAQSAQGQFNQGSVDIANTIGTNRTLQQYDYNSAQAEAANAFTERMWNQTAAWNEAMWERQAEFNSAEAEKNRKWQEQMRATAYQTAMADMKAAGLNPILAYGGINAAAPSGTAATVGGTSMSSAQGQMANGGLLQGQYASESSYSGQMENMSSTLALIGAIVGGLSSAFKGLGSLGDLGEGLGNAIGKMFQSQPYTEYGTGKYSDDAGLKIYEKIFGQKPTKRT